MCIETKKLLQGEMKLKTIIAIAYRKARIKSSRTRRKLSNSIIRLIKGQ